MTRGESKRQNSEFAAARLRVATAAAWQHLGLAAPVEATESPDVTTLFE